MHKDISRPPAPDHQELRQFGLTTGALVILFGVLLPWLGHKDILAWQRVTLPLGSVLILWALLHADSLVYIHKPWMLFSEKLGWINSRIILFALFYVILTPIGLIMRLLGKDPMVRHFDRQLSSYRVRKEAQPREHMETPF